MDLRDRVISSLGIVLTIVLILKVTVVLITANSLSVGPSIFNSSVLGASELGEYADFVDTDVFVICYQDQTFLSLHLVEPLSNLISTGFGTVFVDLPYQAQGFVDAYLNGDATWSQVTESYSIAYGQYDDGSLLESYLPLFNFARDQNFNLVLINTFFSDFSLYLTYPDIPEEYNRDAFMYNFWSKNHEFTLKDIVITHANHCDNAPAIKYGQVFELSDAGSFVPSLEIVDTQEKDYFVQNNGYGSQSLVELMKKGDSISVLSLEDSSQLLIRN